MKGKFVFASILMASSAAVCAQTASRAAIDKATPMLYQCTVTPASNDMAINTKGTGVSGRSAAATATPWSRIDLEFAPSGPSLGQTHPTYNGHAITFKAKEGASTGRVSAPGGQGSAAAVTCADVSGSGSAATRKLYVGNLPYSATNESASDSAATRSAPQGAASQFTCTVTGTVERPQFTIGFWSGTGASRKSGSIVQTDRDSDGDSVSASSRVACTSETAALRGAWSIATDQ